MAARKKAAKKSVKKRGSSQRKISRIKSRTTSQKSSSKSISRNRGKAGSRLKREVFVTRRRFRPTKAVAIIGLLVNILLFPGLGTVIGGRTKNGVWQMVLFGTGLILSVIEIGIIIIIAAWIWALITSVGILQRDVRDL
jgi:TM2 domain-containing membrane protein YozV